MGEQKRERIEAGNRLLWMTTVDALATSAVVASEVATYNVTRINGRAVTRLLLSPLFLYSLPSHLGT